MIKTVIFFVFSVVALSFLIGFAVRVYFSYNHLRTRRKCAERYSVKNEGLNVSLNNQKNCFYSLVDISESGMAFCVHHFPDDFQMTQKITTLIHSDDDKSFYKILAAEVVYIKKYEGLYRIGLKFEQPLEQDDLQRILALHDSSQKKSEVDESEESSESFRAA